MVPITPTSNSISETDVRDARRFLPHATDETIQAFAHRQIRARERVSLLREFYNRNPCRMARLHLLTASSVCLARFCGFSSAFDRMGEAILPILRDGTLKTPAWDTYALSVSAHHDHW
jgi:hypothetical protein